MSDKVHKIYTSQTSDGTFIAASIDSPLFCVGGPSKHAALQRASAALKAFDKFVSNRPKEEPKIIEVFNPVFREEALSA